MNGQIYHPSFNQRHFFLFFVTNESEPAKNNLSWINNFTNVRKNQINYIWIMFTLFIIWISRRQQSKYVEISKHEERGHKLISFKKRGVWEMGDGEIKKY